MLKGKKVLIFDLGGVVIDLFVDRTFAAMAALGIPAEMLTERGCLMDSMMMQFDRGDITADEMFGYIKSFLPATVCEKLGTGLDSEVQRVWNLMLGDVPQAKLQRLAALRSAGYRVVMLSNTNRGIGRVLSNCSWRRAASCRRSASMPSISHISCVAANPSPESSSLSLRARGLRPPTASSSTIRPRTVPPRVPLALMQCLLSATHRGTGYSMNDYADNNRHNKIR